MKGEWGPFPPSFLIPQGMRAPVQQQVYFFGVWRQLIGHGSMLCSACELPYLNCVHAQDPVQHHHGGEQHRPAEWCVEERANPGALQPGNPHS